MTCAVRGLDLLLNILMVIGATCWSIAEDGLECPMSGTPTLASLALSGMSSALACEHYPCIPVRYGKRKQ